MFEFTVHQLLLLFGCIATSSFWILYIGLLSLQAKDTAASGVEKGKEIVQETIEKYDSPEDVSTRFDIKGLG